MTSHGKEISVRPTVPALDSLLGTSLKVLDDGFVRVVDYMGSDDAIVQAARISYGDGTKKTREDRGLIRYLMRHRHTTPFEMCEIKFHIRVPMDCWRQWIRHRTANVNEYSTRYSIAIDAAQKTKGNEWRSQDAANKQGSSDFISLHVGQELSTREAKLQSLARDGYEERLRLGVAREQARKDLPLSTYTEAYWKIDLHNLFHFLELRMAENAQLEIQKYANVIARDIVRIWCPLAWAAFSDYRRGSIELSAYAIDLVRAVNSGEIDNAMNIAQHLGWISKDGKARPNRERREYEEKFRLLGLTPPWHT